MKYMEDFIKTSLAFQTDQDNHFDKISILSLICGMVQSAFHIKKLNQRFLKSMLVKIYKHRNVPLKQNTEMQKRNIGRLQKAISRVTNKVQNWKYGGLLGCPGWCGAGVGGGAGGGRGAARGPRGAGGGRGEMPNPWFILP